MISWKNNIVIMLFSAFALGTMAQKIETFFTTEELNKANTAKQTTWLSAEEKKVFQVLNLARMQPKKFVKYVMGYEGLNKKGAVADMYSASLIKELSSRKAVSPLLPDKRMQDLAKCWAIEAGKAGVTGHERKKCSKGYYGECCDYGSETAEEIVMDLLIDRGVKSLGHRKICLDAKYQNMGVSIQPHQRYGTNTVLDFTYGDQVVSKYFNF